MSSSRIDQDRQACEQGLDRLFSWAVSVRGNDIPSDARRRAAQMLLDDISAMVGAWQEPEFQRLSLVLMQSNRGGAATVFCRPGTKADPETASVETAVADTALRTEELRLGQEVVSTCISRV